MNLTGSKRQPRKSWMGHRGEEKMLSFSVPQRRVEGPLTASLVVV